MRQITIEEWEKYEWIEVGSFGSGYVQGIEKTEPPPKPNDGLAYILIDITSMMDRKQVWKWLPCMTFNNPQFAVEE
jgi:hypothetical protein